MKGFYITDCTLQDRIKNNETSNLVPSDENITLQIELQSSGDTSKIDIFEIEKMIMDKLECLKFDK